MPVPAPYDVPASMRARLDAIRDQMIRDVNAAVADLDVSLRPLAARITAEIDATLVLSPAKRAKRIRIIVKGYYQESNGTIAGAVAEQIADAARYADRYREVLDAFAVGKRHLLRDRPGAGAMKLIPDYQAYAALTEGAGGARASVAYELAGARRAGATVARVAAKTRGDRLMRAGIDRPWAKVGDLSARLHGQTVVNAREATRGILTSIRESESMSSASRELQRQMRLLGTKVAANEGPPRLVRELQDAARRLARSTGDEAARHEMAKVMRKLDGYQKGLAEGQTTQGAYLELLQDVERKGPEYIRKAVEKWTYQKQRYNAERIMRTEKATAYRTAAIEQDKGRAWVVAYIWRMHRGSHARFVRRRPGRLKKFGGNHCLCESMNGERISKEVAAEYPQGAHPHCNCTFEPVIDESRLFEGAPTDSDYDAATEMLSQL